MPVINKKVQAHQPVNKVSVAVIPRNRMANNLVNLLDNNRTDKTHLSKASNLVKDKEKNRKDNWPNHKANSRDNNPAGSDRADNNQVSSRDSKVVNNQANNRVDNREANKVEANLVASRLNL